MVTPKLQAAIERVPLPAPPLPSATGRPVRRRASSQRSYVVGPENAVLAVVLDALREDGDWHWNPIVLCGPTGVGKTHLGVGVAEAARSKGANVREENAVDFAAEYAHAALAGTLAAFRTRYERLDVWVVDDLSELKGKPAAQEELARLLDLLRIQGTRILLLTRAWPSTDEEFVASLASRVWEGLPVLVQPPSREVRRELVEQFALERGIPLSHAAAEVLAEKLPGAREIDAALMALELATQAEGRAIAAEDAEEYVKRQGRPGVELKKIAAETARAFAVKVADLRGASRRQSVAAARAMAMSLARELTDYSLRQIGDYFGGRDHTTVLHACRQAQSRVDDDPQTAQAAASLKRRLIGA